MLYLYVLWAPVNAVSSEGRMSLNLGIRIALYGLCSSALLVLNKVSITAVPNASFLLLIQIFTTIVLIILPALAGYVQVNLRPSVDVRRAYIAVALVFLGTIYSNFKVIESIGVNTFIVLRCGTPLLISILDWLFLGRKLPQGRSVFALTGVFCAGAAYAYSKYQEDLIGQNTQENGKGTSGAVWSLVWLSCFALDMIFIKHVADAYQCTGLERTLYQNTFALPVLLVVLAGPIESAYTVNLRHVDNKSLIAVYLSCLAGAVLSYTGMSLRTDLSATAFTVLGIVCKMGSSLLNEIFVAPETNRVNLLCILGVVLSSSFYKQAPQRETNELAHFHPILEKHHKAVSIITAFALLLLSSYVYHNPVNLHRASVSVAQILTDERQKNAAENTVGSNDSYT
mmetsp:Transcript_11855/g.45923  ORF Transcript_11855/g.45923 Transcript_11855/m.45923 type:complete len:398 (-) Transcript_11855:830-2023(-)